jgi:hypothetical protein
MKVEKRIVLAWGRIQFDISRLSSWFGNSIVVDSTGAPLLLYHGTTDPWFVPALRYGMAPHFGDCDTARTRIDHREWDYHNPDHSDEARLLFPAYLRIEKPVFMRDVHFDEVAEFLAGILETGILSLSEVEAKWGTEFDATMTEIVALLSARGYDGIAYTNNIEGNGTWSWIPFTLEQIWEVPEVPLSGGISR